MDCYEVYIIVLNFPFDSGSRPHLKEVYQLQDENKYTSFDPPTYSILENKKDTDKPSEELLNKKEYIDYCESVLG